MRKTKALRTLSLTLVLLFTANQTIFASAPFAVDTFTNPVDVFDITRTWVNYPPESNTPSHVKITPVENPINATYANIGGMLGFAGKVFLGAVGLGGVGTGAGIAGGTAGTVASGFSLSALA